MTDGQSKVAQGRPLPSTVLYGRFAATGEVVVVKEIQSSQYAKPRYEIFTVSGLAVTLEETGEGTQWMAECPYSGESLWALVETKGPLSARNLQLLGRNLLEGLRSLRDHGVCPRELDPSTIFFEEEGSWNCYFAALELVEDEEGLGISQKTNSSATAAYDIQRLGNILLYAATGHQQCDLSHYSFPHKAFEELLSKMLAKPEDSSADQLLDLAFFKETYLDEELVTRRTLVETSVLRDHLDANCQQHLVADERFHREMKDERCEVYRAILDTLEREEREDDKAITEIDAISREMWRMAVASMRAGTEYQSYQLYDLAAYCYFRTLACVKLWSESSVTRADSWKPAERLCRAALANLKNLHRRNCSSS